MFRTGGIGSDEGQIDFIAGGGRQFLLRLFSFFLQTLQGQLVLAQVDGVFFFELVSEITHDTHVEVFTAEEGVAIGGFHFKHAIADFQHGNVNVPPPRSNTAIVLPSFLSRP